MRTTVWRDAIRDSDLNATAKLVAFVISCYFNSTGENAFPGKDTIAAGASLSLRAVDGAVDRIEGAGFLEIERTKGGNRKSNRYRASLPNPAADAGLTPQELQGSEAPNPASDDKEPRISRHSTPQLTTTNPAADAPEVGLKLKSKPPTEAGDPARVGGALEQQKCVCEPCGRARFLSSPASALAKDIPA